MIVWEDILPIDYDHNLNLHTTEGAMAAFPIIFRQRLPSSLLDVGCGAGTWLRAAHHYGVSDVCGIDGISISSERLLFNRGFFKQVNLTEPVDLGRRFDAAICFEVGEHLIEEKAPTLIETLTRHSDLVVFSAACPDQPGQHHVNAKWPSWWQSIFNDLGYACFDTVRWHLWDDTRIEPWYRQNMFIAQKGADVAGSERRLQSVVHRDMLPLLAMTYVWRNRQQIEAGSMSMSWYLQTAIKALCIKARRQIRQYRRRT